MIFLSHSLQTTEKNIQLLCIYLTRYSMIKQEREHPIYCYEAYITIFFPNISNVENLRQTRTARSMTSKECIKYNKQEEQ